jgi:hypothetical protein
MDSRGITRIISCFLYALFFSQVLASSAQVRDSILHTHHIVRMQTRELDERITSLRAGIMYSENSSVRAALEGVLSGMFSW